MSEFSLSESAKSQIQRILQSSGCQDPVITLSDVGSVDIPADAQAALMNAKSVETQELRDLVLRQVREGRQPDVVVATAYERRECAPEDLTEISGVPFVMTMPMREALRDYSLVCVNGEFMLQGPDELVPNLRSVKTLAAWLA